MGDAKAELMAKYQAAVDAHRRQDLEEALTHYQSVLAIHDAIPAVHNNVAAIRLSQGATLDAEASWRRAVELKPDYAEAHYNLAVLLSERSAEYIDEARTHCELAIEHKEGYVQAHHLLGNILVTQQQPDAAMRAYSTAEALAEPGPTAAASPDEPPAALHTVEGVSVGHVQQLELPSGAQLSATTLALRPLVLLVHDFLSPDECETLVHLARGRLKESLLMGNTSAAERTSTSTFLPTVAHALLPQLQERLAALVKLPLSQLRDSEDLQVVHYREGETFGMHHDSSKFLPRLLTAFYYLSDVDEGGETAFPAADGAMAVDEALALDDPAVSGAGLVVQPRRGQALLFWNHASDGEIEPLAVHAGCRVRRGEKWGANHWVSLRPVKGGSR